MPSGEVHNLMRMTYRRRGRNAEFHAIHVTPTPQHPADFHIGEETIAEQRKKFRSFLYHDFPELLQLVD
jgi:hypothetical protein